MVSGKSQNLKTMKLIVLLLPKSGFDRTASAKPVGGILFPILAVPFFFEGLGASALKVYFGANFEEVPGLREHVPLQVNC